MPFFSGFPLTTYNITKSTRSDRQLVTNIVFRFGIIKEVLSNISAYYIYTLTEGDKPEILAEKIYGDPTSYWIILMANDIYDSQYDWPLDSRSFQKFMVNKYGSIAWAKTNFHHYEKVVQRTESLSGITTETRFEIDFDTLIEDTLDVPYDTYLSLPEEQSFEQIDFNGQTITEIIKRDAITYYDYEDQLNERKRLIKIIKPEYYSQILAEYNSLTNDRLNPRLRRLI
jgi:hypothetical protein